MVFEIDILISVKDNSSG